MFHRHSPAGLALVLEAKRVLTEPDTIAATAKRDALAISRLCMLASGLRIRNIYPIRAATH